MQETKIPVTWDEIYERAEGTAFMSPELQAKDTARWQLRNFMLSLGMDDIEGADVPEDEIDWFCDLYEVLFDDDGKIINADEMYQSYYQYVANAITRAILEAPTADAPGTQHDIYKVALGILYAHDVPFKAISQVVASHVMELSTIANLHALDRDTIKWAETCLLRHTDMPRAKNVVLSGMAPYEINLFASRVKEDARNKDETFKEPVVEKKKKQKKKGMDR